MTSNSITQKITDLNSFTGTSFGRLKVIGVDTKIYPSGQKLNVLKCLCSCGNITNVRKRDLINKTTSSCGCYRKETPSATKHGNSFSPEYRAWATAKNRCYNTNNRAYKSYGGRNITMSSEWLNSYPTFLKDMGKRPSLLHSIDRRNNDKGYNKENCYWATKKQQNSNKRDTTSITFNNQTKNLSDWAKYLNKNYATLYSRLKYLNWTIEKAFTL